MECIHSGIETFYKQHVDWTCGLAALRTLLNATHFKYHRLSEETLIEKNDLLQLVHGPKTGADLKLIAGSLYRNHAENPILTKENMLSLGKDLSVVELFKEYNMAVECSLMGGHWLPIVSIMSCSTENKVTLYDSYFDSLIELELQQFEALWRDEILLKNEHEFIAVRR